jgi:hypothetical protein
MPKKLDQEELYAYLYECGVLTDQLKKILQFYFESKDKTGS